MIPGKTVKRVEVVNASKLKVSKEALKKAVEKQQLTEVERVGKELHFKFSNGNIFGLHLILHGKLYYDKIKTFAKTIKKSVGRS